MTSYQPHPILVPSDLSSSSAEAVRVARQIARDDEQVTVVYVALDHDLIAPGNIWGMDDVVQETAEECKERLSRWIADNNLGSVRQEIRRGDPGMEICKLANDLSCPLIVVPSHGRKGLSRILLGSVAERIIRHADCSVLVVRRDGTEEESISDWQPRQRVVVPIDLSESSALAVDTALQLVAEPQHVDVINVVYTMNDTLAAGSIAVTQEDLEKNRSECLQRFLHDHGWTSLSSHILFGEPGMSIADYADDTMAELVVMPSHGFHGFNRLLLGSTTERVLRHTKAPVLVLRRLDAEPHNG